jgi:hypothetical protein
LGVADYDWRRYLDLVLDGFRASDALAVGAEHRPDKITT